MKLKTKLVSSYTVIISLVLAVFLAWYFEDILKFEDRYTDASTAGIQKVIDDNYALSKVILSEYGKRTLRASSDLLTLELSEMLKGKDSSDYAALRDDRDFAAKATQPIRTVEGEEIGYYDVYDRKGFAVLHPSKAIEGRNYSEWADKYPKMWELVKRSFSEDRVEGEYSFLEQEDGEEGQEVKISSVPKIMYCRHIPGTGLILCSAVNKEKYYTDAHRQIGASGAKAIMEVGKIMTLQKKEFLIWTSIWGVLGFLVLLALGMAMGYSVSGKISNPIMDLCGAVNKIGKGDFSAKLQVPENAVDEIKVLAEDFNTLGGRLADYTDKLGKEISSREAMEGEIKAAKRIQESLLPGKDRTDFPLPNDLELLATLEPAKNVSGDFYDYFLTGSGKAVLIIADVSGKGIPAALFMAVCRTLLRSIALGRTAESTSAILEAANSFLCKENESCMFVTLFLCIFDPKTGEMKFSNAGHNPAIIFGKDGNPCEIGDFRNPPLGIDPKARYGESSGMLEKGSAMLLYTDGITEAMSPEGKIFGFERMMSFFKSNLSASQADTSRNLLAELDKFQSGRQYDDITFIQLRRS